MRSTHKSRLSPRYFLAIGLAISSSCGSRDTNKPAAAARSINDEIVKGFSGEYFIHEQGSSIATSLVVESSTEILDEPCSAFAQVALALPAGFDAPQTDEQDELSLMACKIGDLRNTTTYVGRRDGIQCSISLGPAYADESTPKFARTIVYVACR
jgi:hypothetical protein